MYRFKLTPFSMPVVAIVFLLIAFPFAATESANAQSEKGNSQLTAEQMFAPDRVTDIQIELDEADWNEIRAQGRSFAQALSKKRQDSPFSYVKGNVTIDGVIVKNVGIRKKGFLGSLNNQRPSLKIKFEEYEKQSPVEGLDRLTLNNNNQDAGRICQYLCYKLYRESGTHAPRCGFAKVTVNGKYLGIYSNVEAIKSDFLKHSFGDDSGELYEGTVADFFPEIDKSFEQKNKAANHELVHAVTEVLESDEVDFNELAKLVDVDSFLKFWAMESLIGFWDGYCSNQNNFYMYRDPESKKFDFIPWGTDSAFTDVSPIPPHVIRPRSVHAKAILPNKLYRNEKIKADYQATMMKLLEEHWNEKDILAEIDRLEGMLEKHVAESNDGFDRTMRGYRRFIKGRREGITDEFADGSPKLKSREKRPLYFAELGTVEASFSTKWFDKEPKDATKSGEVSVNMSINGKTIELLNPGVYARKDDRNPVNATIIVKGTSKATGKEIIIGVGMPKTDFAPSDKPISAGGILIQPGSLGMVNGKMKMMFGVAELSKASLKPGEPVVGTLSMKVGDFKSSGAEDE